jgi:hypothetical protein
VLTRGTSTITDVPRQGKPNPIGILIGILVVKPSLTCDNITDTVIEPRPSKAAELREFAARIGMLDC